MDATAPFAFHGFSKEPDILFLEIEPGGIIIHASETCEQLTGFSREEIEGLPLEALFHPSTARDQVDQMHRTLKDGHPWRGCVFLSQKGGSACRMELIISAVRHDGMVAGCRRWCL